MMTEFFSATAVLFATMGFICAIMCCVAVLGGEDARALAGSAVATVCIALIFAGLFALAKLIEVTAKW